MFYSTYDVLFYLINQLTFSKDVSYNEAFKFKKRRRARSIAKLLKSVVIDITESSIRKVDERHVINNTYPVKLWDNNH